MSAIAAIAAQIFKKDSGFASWKYDCANPMAVSSVSTDFEIQGAEYFVPQIRRGVIVDYAMSLISGGTSDEIATVRMRHKTSGEIIWILGVESDWRDRVNACCGATPAMPVITTGAALENETPCYDTDASGVAGPSDFYAQHNDPIIAGQKLQIVGKNDGVAFTPAPAGAGYATVALALAFAQASWGAYGAFTPIYDSATGATVVGIKLSGTAVRKGTFDLQLMDVAYCCVIVAAQVYNQIKVNNVLIPLDTTVTAATATQVILAIDNKIDGTLLAFAPTKIQYTGKNVPQGLYMNGASVAAFTAGVCS